MAQLWFKFWAKDYLGDGKIGCLSYEKRGILQTLWAYAWESGGIPADPALLGELLKLKPKDARVHREWILQFFHPSLEDPSKLISPRLELERMEADGKGAKARESALRRWNNRNANAYPDALRLGMPDRCDLDAGQSQGQGLLKEDPVPAPEAPPAPRTPKADAMAPLREEILSHWRAVAVPAGLPNVFKGTVMKLRGTMNARLADPDWLELFREAVDYAARNPAGAWMRGEGDRAWKVTLEWLLKPGKAEETAAKARAVPGRASPGRNPSAVRPSSNPAFPKLLRAGEA